MQWACIGARSASARTDRFRATPDTARRALEALGAAWRRAACGPRGYRGFLATILISVTPLSGISRETWIAVQVGYGGLM